MDNIFFPNPTQKTLTKSLTNLLDKLLLPIIIYNKKEEKVKDILNDRSYKAKL